MGAVDVRQAPPFFDKIYAASVHGLGRMQIAKKEGQRKAVEERAQRRRRRLMKRTVYTWRQATAEVVRVRQLMARIRGRLLAIELGRAFEGWAYRVHAWVRARKVSTKALSFCCAPTVFLSKTVPFLAVLLGR
eukprot:SAG22_NODE_69_length_22779_cov_71.088139_2_plen_133_part_00